MVNQIWSGRNGVIFRGSLFEASAMFDQIRTRSWEWLRTKSRGLQHAISEWYMEPLVCLSGIFSWFCGFASGLYGSSVGNMIWVTCGRFVLIVEGLLCLMNYGLGLLVQREEIL